MNAFLLFLWKRKVFICSFSALILAYAFLYAFRFTKPEYKAQVTFLTPSEGSTVGAAVMGIQLAGGTSIMYDQVEVVFNSASLKKRFIDRFSLYKMWHIDRNPERFETGLVRLKNYIDFKSTVKGSMGFEKIIAYTITCYHPSPDTAKMMCDFAFTLIDSSVKYLSTNLAHHNRIFIEDHLEMHKHILDSLQKAFEMFQLANKAFVMPDQMRLSLKNYADIKSSAIINELKIKSLQQEFRGDFPELEELENHNRLYNQQLMQIESDTKRDVLPSLELSAKLLPQYSNLSREIDVENQVIILLTRELEQARVQEQRNVSLLSVIDPPFVPVHKARPRRLLLIGLIFISFNFALFLIYCYLFYFSSVVMNNEDFKSLMQAIKSKKQ